MVVTSEPQSLIKREQLELNLNTLYQEGFREEGQNGRPVASDAQSRFHSQMGVTSGGDGSEKPTSDLACDKSYKG